MFELYSFFSVLHLKTFKPYSKCIEYSIIRFLQKGSFCVFYVKKQKKLIHLDINRWMKNSLNLHVSSGLFIPIFILFFYCRPTSFLTIRKTNLSELHSGDTLHMCTHVNKHIYLGKTNGWSNYFYNKKVFYSDSLCILSCFYWIIFWRKIMFPNYPIIFSYIQIFGNG